MIERSAYSRGGQLGYVADWGEKIFSEEKKDELCGAGLLFGGVPHRLDEGQRLAESVSSRARFQFLPLHPSLLTRRISPRRIIAWRDCACGRACVILVRNPDKWTP